MFDVLVGIPLAGRMTMANSGLLFVRRYFRYAYTSNSLAPALSTKVYSTAFAIAPFGVSANNHARLAVANGLMFASQRLFESARRPSSRNVSKYSFWFAEYVRALVNSSFVVYNADVFSTHDQKTSSSSRDAS